MRYVVSAVLAAALVGGLAGCADQAGSRIDPHPSYAVQYALQRVSPAVVRLDIVAETYENGAKQGTRAIGSGVIIDPEGHVLTNFHVAGQAKRIDSTLANMEHVRATLVGADHWTDLALVQLNMDEIKARGLKFEWAPLGDSGEVQLGQPVMTLGTPYGLTRTLTAGIVSNTDRFFTDSTIEGGYETGWFNNWIQTDAAINPGNSGGPLINLKGEVIGINTRASATGNNLGFAIPSNVAKEVIREILDHKSVRRSYVGVQLQPLQDLEKHYELSADKGVLIRSVDAPSPASAAGIQDEDILLAVNGQPVTARFPEQLAAVRGLIAAQPVGAIVKLTVQHPGKGPDRVVTVDVRSEPLESVATEEQSVDAWGASARDLTRAYQRQKRIQPFVEGVLVTGVRTGAAGEKADLRSGDIVLKVDDQKVTTTDELLAAVKAAARKAIVRVDVRRDRNETTLLFKQGN